MISTEFVFLQAEDGIRDVAVTGVQTCALPIFFVGGSLVNVGGHSPLEPAAWGKAVVFGPHMDHFAEAAEQFLACDAGVMVRDTDEMAQVMTALLTDRSRLEAMGKAAYQLVLENQGALTRTVALIANVLEGR